MNKEMIKKSLSRAGLQLKKYSPEIMVFAGVAGAVTSTILACKATRKIDDILEPAKEDIQKIHDARDGKIELPAEVEYTEKDFKQDIIKTYASTGLKVAKLYAPAASVGIVSIASILGGYNVMRKRYVASVAAYTAVNEGFREYRNRVVERFGKDVDRELRYDIKAKKLEGVVQDGEQESGINKKAKYADADAQRSEFARFFNSDSRNWERSFEYNMMFLKAQQNLANDILKSRGHLFLNEVYDLLDIPHSSIGQVVGWVLNNPNGDGDGFVDFGLPTDEEVYLERIADDGNKKYARAIPLDFNVDGVVWDLI